MRLTDIQVQQIIKALNNFLDKKAALYLYGSRTNDALKGGDIDLLIVVPNNKTVNLLLNEKHKILAQIKKYIGDQKIDLKISDQQELKKDSFLQIIFPTSILLHRWE